MKEQVNENNLRLIVFQSAKELGEQIDKELLKLYGLDPKKNTFIIPIKENFFEDGHLKVEIQDTVRSKDVYLLTDIGNYSIEYNMHGYKNHTSPNDLMMELKDGIGACNSHASSVNIIMPLLYAGRQHRRNTRENLACGMVLNELDHVKSLVKFITFDAHDQGVEHAIHNMEFDNFIPTNTILTNIINDLTIDDLKKVVFVAPDNGATGRRNVYLNSFNSKHIHREAGSFIKQRDYNNLVDGKYPVISHDYCGNSKLEGYTAIISDDMISSGGSMFDVIDELNKMKVKKIIVAVTYSLFTRGIDKFKEYYEKGLLSGIYTTNLSYIPKKYHKEKWLHICNCAPMVANIIYKLKEEQSISGILRDKSEPIKLLEEKFKSVK